MRKSSRKRAGFSAPSRNKSAAPAEDNNMNIIVEPEPRQTSPTPSSSKKSSPSPGTPGSVNSEASTTSSLNAATSELPLKDWILYYYEQTKRFPEILLDDFETIEKKCMKTDIPKLAESNNKGARILAQGLVQQFHLTIQKHVVGLLELDKRMCEEFSARYPKLPNHLFNMIKPEELSPVFKKIVCKTNLTNNDLSKTAEDVEDMNSGIDVSSCSPIPSGAVRRLSLLRENDDVDTAAAATTIPPLTNGFISPVVAEAIVTDDIDEEIGAAAAGINHSDRQIGHVTEDEGEAIGEKLNESIMDEEEAAAKMSVLFGMEDSEEEEKPKPKIKTSRLVVPLTSTSTAAAPAAEDKEEKMKKLVLESDESDNNEDNDDVGSESENNKKTTSSKKSKKSISPTKGDDWRKKVILSDNSDSDDDDDDLETFKLRKKSIDEPAKPLKEATQARVKLIQLSEVILNELEKHNFIRIDDSDVEDDEDDKILAALKRKIRVKTTSLNQTKQSTSRLSRKAKDKKPTNGLVSGSDDEDEENEGLPEENLKLQNGDIRPKDLKELMSASLPSDASEVSTASDDEDEARKEVLRECKISKKSRKPSETDGEAPAKRELRKRTKILTPRTGPEVKFADSDSDDSESSSKRTRRSRRTRNALDPAKKKKKSDAEDSEDQSDDRARGKSSKDRKPSRSHREGKALTPSKTGLVADSDPEAKDSGDEKKDDKKAEAMESKKAKIIVLNSDSDSETPVLPSQKKVKVVKVEASSKSKASTSDSDVSIEVVKKKKQESDSSGSDSDFVPAKKAKISSFRQKKRSKSSSGSEASSDSDSGKNKKGKSRRKKHESNESSDDSNKKKKKKHRRRIKANSSSEGSEKSDDDGNEGKSPNKGRKDIRKLIKDKDLQISTKEAAKEEEARKSRILEKQTMYNTLFNAPQSDKLESLVLDFDKEAKTPLVSVDPEIVGKLKPHQAKGIQFMWDACFESLEAKKEGGCILAHCMGLGKTLQSVAFAHTVLNKKEIGVKRLLVVCPLNTVGNWYSEFRKWTEDAEGRIFVHRLWEDKGKDRYTGLQKWKKNGGVGILHYDGFRAIVNSDLKKGKQKVQKKYLEIIKDTLVDPGADMIIADEGHLLKNAKSQLSIAMNKVKTKRRIVLTGTPLQNNLVEYHTMMSFVKPSLLGDIKEFNNRFVNPILNGQHKDSQAHDVHLMKKRAHVLHKLLEGCVQRLDYNVLVPYLPPKFEYAIHINLSDKQKDLYDHYIKYLAGNTGTEQQGFSSTKLFTDYTVLNKVCTHPIALTFKTASENRRSTDGDESEGSLKDFIDDESTPDESSDVGSGDDDWVSAQKKKIRTRSSKPDPAVEELPKPEPPPPNPGVPEPKWYERFFESISEMRKTELSGKLKVLIEILKISETVGDKVLIFSQYLTTLDIIEEVLESLDEEARKANRKKEDTGFASLQASEGRYRPQIDYFRIDGSTKTNIRQDQCEKFNQNLNAAKVFLISIRAGGLGINLYGANRVVIFDCSWNPSQDMQAIFRVYRFGQTKPSYIYRLLSRGTMEEKIYNRQVVKLSLSCRVVDEQQIERHYHYDDLKQMYQFNKNDPTERPTPAVPKDKLLAELLQTQKDWIFSYLEHDSLLENKEEEELSEDAKKIAWEEFNNEGTRMSNLPQYPKITAEDLIALYQKNSGFFGGDPNWVIRALNRLHYLHPILDLTRLGQGVREIETSIESLITNFHVMTNSTSYPPFQVEIARNMCKNTLLRLRQTYKNTIGPDDLRYLGPRTQLNDALIKLVCPNFNEYRNVTIDMLQQAQSLQMRQAQQPRILRQNAPTNRTISNNPGMVGHAVRPHTSIVNTIPRPYVPPTVEID